MELQALRANMELGIKSNVVYHADCGSSAKKRWCAKAVLGIGGRYTASAPEPVSLPTSLIGRLRTEATDDGCAFAGFDFPTGIPVPHAARALRHRQ